MLVRSRPDTSKAETPASVQNIIPPDQERDGHRQPHHDPGLNGSGTYGEHHEIRDRKPNGDPEDPFRGPLECLSGHRAYRDHRRYSRHKGLLVPQYQRRRRPGQGSR